MPLLFRKKETHWCVFFINNIFCCRFSSTTMLRCGWISHQREKSSTWLRIVSQQPKARVTPCNLWVAILCKVVDSYCIALKFVWWQKEPIRQIALCNSRLNDKPRTNLLALSWSWMEIFSIPSVNFVIISLLLKHGDIMYLLGTLNTSCCFSNQYLVFWLFSYQAYAFSWPSLPVPPTLNSDISTATNIKFGM